MWPFSKKQSKQSQKSVEMIELSEAIKTIKRYCAQHKDMKTDCRDCIFRGKFPCGLTRHRDPNCWPDIDVTEQC